MPTNISEILVAVFDVAIIFGVLLFFSGVINVENSWGWRIKRMRVGSVITSLSGTFLIILLILPHL